MLVLIIGVCMFLGLALAVYLGFRDQYTASEGFLALLVLEVFFVSIGLVVYGLIQIS